MEDRTQGDIFQSILTLLSFSNATRMPASGLIRRRWNHLEALEQRLFLNVSPVVEPIAPILWESADPVWIETTWTDPDEGQDHWATVDWGDGCVESSMDYGQVSACDNVAVGWHTYSAYGTYEGTLTVWDSENGSGQSAFSVQVCRPRPFVYLSIDAGTYYEGDVVRCWAMCSDPVSAPAEWTIDWGDGEITSASPDIEGGNGYFSHAYAEGTITYHPRVQCVLLDGTVAETSRDLQVLDKPPDLAGAVEATSVLAGGVFSLHLDARSIYGSDPLLGWRVDWGDGSPVEGFDPTADTVTHVYTAAGDYALRAWGVDRHGEYDVGPVMGDARFGDLGIVRIQPASSMAERSDGKTIVGGLIGSGVSGWSAALWRLDVDGSIDPSFGDGGVAIVDPSIPVIRCLAVDSLDRIIVMSNDAGGARAWRLLPDGQTDLDFGVDGYAVLSNCSTVPAGVVCQSDDKIVFAMTHIVDGQYHQVVGRLTVGGSLDSTFGTDGLNTALPGWVRKMTLLQHSDSQNAFDGLIYFAGEIGDTSDGNVTLARLDSSGQLDRSFDVDGYVIDSAPDRDAGPLTLDSEGRVYLVIRKGLESLVRRYLPSGEVDETFGVGGDLVFPAPELRMQLAMDGSWLLLAGYQATVSQRRFLERYDLAGNPDVEFGLNGRLFDTILGKDMLVGDDHLTLLEYSGIERYFKTTRVHVIACPIAQTQTIETMEDQPVSGFVQAAGDGENLTFSLGSGPAHGQVSFNADGTFQYEPAPDFNGLDSFEFFASDGTMRSAPAVVTINIMPADDAPAGAGDSYTLPAGAVLQVDSASRGLLANDTDVDGDILWARLLTPPEHGSLILNADGTFTYDPQGFIGQESFTYVLSDGHELHEQTASVTLLIHAGNTAPGLNDQVDYAFNLGQALCVGWQSGLLAHGGDYDGDFLRAWIIPGSLSGPHAQSATLYVGADGALEFSIPADALDAGDFSGGYAEYTFQYVLGDGLAQTTGQAHVRVHLAPPVGRDQAFATVHDRLLSVPGGLLQGSVSRTLLPLTVSCTDPQIVLDGNGGFSYQPPAGFVGTRTFAFTISDGLSASEYHATISVTDTPPICEEDYFVTGRDCVLELTLPDQSVLANDMDADGDPLFVSNFGVFAGPEGTWELTREGLLTFTPAAGFTGQAVLHYTVSDGALGGTSPSTAVVLVRDQAPLGQWDYYETSTGQRLEIPAANGVLSNDVGAGAETLVAELISPPAVGTLDLRPDGSFTYCSPGDFAGEVNFSYRLSQGAQSGGAMTVTLVVRNNPPAALDDFLSAAAGNDLDIPVGSLLANDFDLDAGATLSLALFTQPQHGTLSRLGDVLTYHPDEGFCGTDAFSYWIDDGQAQSPRATVTITVAAPELQAVDDSIVLSEDSAGVCDVLANDIYSGAVVLAADTGPLFGSVSVNGLGQLIYTPDANFFGEDCFAYTVTDGLGRSVQAWVNVNVLPVNDPAAISPLSYCVATGSTVSGNFLVGAQDVDLVELTISGVTGLPASMGTIDWDRWGNFTLHVSNAAFGQCSLDVQVVDASPAGDVPVTLPVTIKVINFAPQAASDSYSMRTGAALDVPASAGVLANDLDECRASLTVTLLNGPSEGEFQLYPDGSFVFIPAAGQVGTFAFSYMISDGVNAPVAGQGQLRLVDVGSVEAFYDGYSCHPGRELAVSATHGVLANDIGASMTVELVDDVASGSLSLLPDGSFTYLLTAGEYALCGDSVTFTYRVLASGVPTDAVATATIDISNYPPVACDDFYSYAHGTNQVADGMLGVLANDFDHDGDPLRAILLDQSGQPAPLGPDGWREVSVGGDGCLRMRDDGAFTFNAPAHQTGEWFIPYLVSDGRTAPGMIHMSVRDERPVCLPRTYRIHHSATMIVDPRTCSYDGDGDTLRVASYSPISPSEGSLVLLPDGTFQFSPAGSVSNQTIIFSVALTDDALDDAGNLILSEPVFFKFEVWNTLASPCSDTFWIHHTQSLTANVLANDGPEIDGDGLSAYLYTPEGLVSSARGAHGLFNLTPQGMLTYTPDFPGVVFDSIQYLLTDGVELSMPAHIDVNIEDNAPSAYDDTFRQPVTQEVIGDVGANDFDYDIRAGREETLVFELVTPPQCARAFSFDNGYFSYQADPDRVALTQSSSDRFTYRVFDGAAYSRIATVTLVFTSGSAYAGDDGFFTSTGREFPADDQAEHNILSNDIIPGSTAEKPPRLIIDGQYVEDSISFETANGGQVTLSAGGDVTYTSAPEFAGTDSFTYTVVSPVDGSCSSATVEFTVLGGVVKAVDDGYSVLAGEVLTVDAAAGVRANDEIRGIGDGAAPPDSAVSAGGSTVRGGTISLSADGSFTYTPPADFCGFDSFTYTVRVGGLASTASVSIVVYSPSPVAAGDVLAGTEGQPIVVPISDLLANDVAGSPAGALRASDLQIVSGPQGGEASIIEVDGQTCLRIAPAAGFWGSDALTYKLVDRLGNASDCATVSLTFAPVARPCPADDFATTLEGQPVTIDALANDLDPDHPGMVPAGSGISEVLQPGHGTAELQQDGTIIYQPVAGWAGEDIFYYRPTWNGSSVVPIRVTVCAANRAPTAPNITRTANVGVPLVIAPSSLIIDSDDSSPELVEIVQSPSSGWAWASNNGIVYFPLRTTTEPQTIGYRVYDHQWQVSQEGIVTVNVMGGVEADNVPQPPEAAAIEVDLPENECYTCEDYGLEMYGSGGLHASIQPGKIVLTGGTYDEGASFCMTDLVGAPWGWDVVWSGNNVECLSIDCSGDFSGSVVSGGYVIITAGGSIDADIDALGDVCVLGGGGGDVDVDATGRDVTVGVNTSNVYSAGQIRGHIVAQQDIYIASPCMDYSPVGKWSLIADLQAGRNVSGLDMFKGDISVTLSADTVYTSGHLPYEDWYIRAYGDISGSFTIRQGSVIVESVYGSVNASFTAGCVEQVSAAKDIIGTIESTSTGSSVMSIAAGRDIGASIRVKNLILANAGRDITGLIEADSIDIVSAGRDMLSDLTSLSYIDTVWAYSIISAQIVAQAGAIEQVSAGEQNSNPQLSSPGLITDTTIRASGDIGSVQCFAPAGLGNGSAGAMTNVTIVSETGGIDYVMSAGAMSGSISAGLDIGELIASGDLSASVDAYGGGIGSICSTRGGLLGSIHASGDIGGVKPVEAKGNISGGIRSDNGSLSGVVAGASLLGSLWALMNIGNVSAGGRIVGSLYAGGSIGAILSGCDISSERISAGGSIGDIGAGAHINSAIEAGGSIGSVWAGFARRPDGLTPTAWGYINAGAPIQDGPAPDIDDPEIYKSANGPVAPTLGRIDAPQTAGGGSVSGSLNAGVTIGTITITGGLAGSVTSGAGVGGIWVLGDIANANGRVVLDAGSGQLLSTCWGSFDADVNAAGDVSVKSFGAMAGQINAGGKASLVSWSNVAEAMAPLVTAGEIDVWSLGGVHLAKAVSTKSAVINAWSDVAIDSAQVPSVAVTATGSLKAELTTSYAVVITLMGQEMTFVTGPDAEAKKGAGYFLAYTGGNLKLVNKVEAPKGAIVFARGTVTGAISSNGEVMIAALGDADVSVNSKSRVSVEANKISGSIEANMASLKAAGDVDAKVVTTGDVVLEVRGNLVGSVKAGGDVSASVTGNVTCGGAGEAGISSSGSVGVTAWGSIGTWIKSGKNIVARALGAIRDSKFEGRQIELVTWDSFSSTVSAAVDAIVFSAGTIEGSITAVSGCVSVESWSSISAPVSAGDEATVTAFGSILPAAKVTAGQYARVSAHHDVKAEVTSTAGGAEVSAGGAVSAKVKAQGGISVVARSVGNVDGNLTLESTAGDVSVTTLEDCLLGSTGSMPSVGSRGIIAATGAHVYAGGSAKVAVKTSGVSAAVSITALGRGCADGECLLALVEAPEADVDILSGANAKVSITAGDATAAPNNVSVAASGKVHDSDLAARISVSVSGEGGSDFASAVSATIRTTLIGSGQIVVSAVGDVDGSYTSGGGLTVSATGDIAGIFSAGALGASVCAMGSILNGSISSGGNVVAAASGDADGVGLVGADVSAGGDATVSAFGVIVAKIDAGASASVSSMYGSILEDINAVAGIFVFAGGDILANLRAGGDISAASMFMISSNATSVNGSISLSALRNVTGNFDAQTAVQISAGAFDGSVTCHGGGVSIASGGGLSSSRIEASGGIDLTAAGAIAATATGELISVCSLGSIGGNYVATGSGVTITAGDSFDGSVSAAGSAAVTALNSISGSIAAQFSADVTACGQVSAGVTAAKGPSYPPAAICIMSGGDVSGPISAAFGSVIIDAAGDVTMSVTAGQDVQVFLQGDLTGSVNAGTQAAVNSGGAVIGDVKADGDITISTLAAVSSQGVSAGGTLSIQATQGISHSLLSAGGDLLLTLGNTMSISTFDATCGGNGNLLILGDLVLSNISADGDLSISSTGAAGSGLDRIEAQGMIDITAGGLIGADVIAVGSVALFCLGAGVSGTVTSGGDLTIVCRGSVSSPIISSVGPAEIVALGDIVGGSIISQGDIRVATPGTINDGITAWGSVSINTGSSLGVQVSAGQDARVMTQDGFTGRLEVSGKVSHIYVGGDFAGVVHAVGRIERLVVGGDMGDNGTSVVSDSSIDSILVMGRVGQGCIHAAGQLSDLTACGDISLADIDADTIGSILSYGAIDAQITTDSFLNSVAAAGNISGTISSPVWGVGSVRAGGSITAAIDAPECHVVENDHYAAAGPAPQPTWANVDNEMWSSFRAEANLNNTIRQVLQAATQAQQTMQSLARASAAHEAFAAVRAQQVMEAIAQAQAAAGGGITAAGRQVASAMSAGTTSVYRQLEKESAAQAQRAGAANAQIDQSRYQARLALREATADIDKALADLNAQQKRDALAADQSGSIKRAEFAAELAKIQKEATPEVRDRNWQEQVNTVKPQMSQMIDKLVREELLDDLQMVLSWGSLIVSFVPGVGMVASAAMSAANGCISLARGNYAEAAMDLLLPAVGAAGKVAGKLSRMYLSSEKAIVRALKFVNCKALARGCFVSGTLVAVPAADGATFVLPADDALQAGLIDQGQWRRQWVYASAALGVAGVVGGCMIARRRPGRNRRRSLSALAATQADEAYLDYAKLEVGYAAVSDAPAAAGLEK